MGRAATISPLILQSAVTEQRKQSRFKHQWPLQSPVGLPACAAGFPLMKTFDDPPITTPPHSVLPPTIAAGLPLMKTFGEPSTTPLPLVAPSPTRAAGLPPIIVSGLP